MTVCVIIDNSTNSNNTLAITLPTVRPCKGLVVLAVVGFQSPELVTGSLNKFQGSPALVLPGVLWSAVVRLVGGRELG